MDRRFDLAWSFRPRPRLPSLEEERRFQGEVRSALRIAAGLRTAVRVRWESGRDGGLSVRGEGRSGASWVRRVLRPVYAPGQWTPVADGDRVDLPPPSWFAALAGPEWLPLPFTVDRPPWSEAVLRALATLGPGVRVDWEARAGPSGRAALPSESAVGSATSVDPRERVRHASRFERELWDHATERAHGVLWMVRAEIRGVGGVPADRISEVVRVIAVASRLEGGNALRFRRRVPALRIRARWMVFSEPELVGLFPSPWMRGLPEPAFRSYELGLPLGRSAEGRPVVVPVEREQGRHLIVVGETGMGKSSLVVRLLRAASRRDAVVLLDPIGDTGRSFLSALAPAQRSRTTWVSPVDSPVGINALRFPSNPGELGNEGGRAIPELTAALRRVRTQRYVEAGFWGPRIEEGLGRALQLASALPGGTLREAFTLLDDPSALDLPIPPSLSGAVHAFASFVRERPEEVAGSRRVLGELVGNPVLARLLCARDARFSFAEAGSPGAITVITGDAPKVGEATARALLAVDLALLWASLLARTNPSKVFVTLEEAQWYAHESLLELLRLGRRSNLHVWTVTQSLRSMGESLREALLTNSADLILFRGDPEECREFARWNPELTPERMLSLGRGEAMSMTGKGSDLRWCRVDPPLVTSNVDGPLDEVAETSRARWCRACDPAHDNGPSPGDPDQEGGTERALEWVRRTRGFPATLAVREVGSALGLTREELRLLGSELKVRGALVRSYTTELGRYWVLREATQPAIPQRRPATSHLAPPSNSAPSANKTSAETTVPPNVDSVGADEPKGH